MTAIAAAALLADRRAGDLLVEYDAFVNAIDLNPAQRSQRRRAARRFLERHGDPQTWLDERSTPTRLVDLHRLKAWPWLTWLVIDRRVRADLELLLAKPGGVDIGVWWALANQADITTATMTATGLGWSPNWTRQVLGHTAPVLCLWLDKPFAALSDGDFDQAAA